ncbi:MAG: hypothetical protein R8G66_13530 [Cytophagales bacterium]|nr:hypothetical protein [Cytophagales bacterium]
MNTKQKSNLLIVLGLLFVAFIKILAFYVQFGDVMEGFLMGAGIGLMVMGLLTKRQQSASRN